MRWVSIALDGVASFARLLLTHANAGFFRRTQCLQLLGALEFSVEHFEPPSVLVQIDDSARFVHLPSEQEMALDEGVFEVVAHVGVKERVVRRVVRRFAVWVAEAALAGSHTLRQV